ncbi:MAG: tRNA-dihydrouridine synthase, partial [Coriobacteriales bacterium]|nr:tRNA-dihydrouridine synthase [Coriobacteriales bacterium]
EDDGNAVEFALAMESAGAAGLAVHGRTRGQMYKGRADWNIVAEVKQAVSVPVIGSGDVFSADDVVAMLAETGADGVMVARGAQGNPWIFRESRSLLQTGERVAPPTAVERLEIALEHARELVRYAGERAFPRMRKHVAWYLTGMPGATHARARAFECATLADLEELFAEYRAFVTRSAA